MKGDSGRIGERERKEGEVSALIHTEFRLDGAVNGSERSVGGEREALGVRIGCSPIGLRVMIKSGREMMTKRL